MIDAEPITDNKEQRELEFRYRQLQDIFHHFMTLPNDERDEAYKAIIAFLEKNVDEKLVRYMADHVVYSRQLDRNVKTGLQETSNVNGVEMREFSEDSPYVIAKVAADGTIEGVAHNLDVETDPELRIIFGHVALLKALSPEHLRAHGTTGGIRVPENYRKLVSIGFGRHAGSNEIPVVHYHGGASLGASGRVGNREYIEALLGRQMKNEWEDAGLMDSRLADATTRAAATGRPARHIAPPIRTEETHEIDQ